MRRIPRRTFVLGGIAGVVALAYSRLRPHPSVKKRSATVFPPSWRVMVGVLHPAVAGDGGGAGVYMDSYQEV